MRICGKLGVHSVLSAGQSTYRKGMAGAAARWWGIGRRDTLPKARKNPVGRANGAKAAKDEDLEASASTDGAVDARDASAASDAADAAAALLDAGPCKKKPVVQERKSEAGQGSAGRKERGAGSSHVTSSHGTSSHCTSSHGTSSHVVSVAQPPAAAFNYQNSKCSGCVLHWVSVICFADTRQEVKTCKHIMRQMHLDDR
jgi:hypothetical protein